MEFALAILATVLSILFVHSLFWDGMLLAPIRRNYLRHLPLFFRKCLFECPPCMTSVWGLLMYGAASFHLGYDLLGFITGLLPFLFCVGGLLILTRPLIAQAEDLYGEYFVLTQERLSINKLKLELEARATHLEKCGESLNNIGSVIASKQRELDAWEQDLSKRGSQPIGYKVRKPSVLKAKNK